MSHDSDHQTKSTLPRGEAIKLIAAVPAIAAIIARSATAAQAADNKKQFRYQDHPHKGQTCSGCRFFRKPAACSIVTGKISPHGWCIAWAKR